MQALLIIGIGIAIVAVLFAIQNNTPVTVGFLAWSFDGSLALVLLMALGLGALIAGLISSPTVIRGQWAGSRLRRQIAQLEEENRALQQRLAAAEARTMNLEPSPPPALQDKPYVGLKTLITGQGGEPPPGTR